MRHHSTLLVLASLLAFCSGDYDYRTSNQNPQTYNTRSQYYTSQRQPEQYDSRNQQYDNGGSTPNEWSPYQFSIDEGHCAGSKLVDEEVQKDADPYTFKKTTYTWTGRDMFKVTCVRVLNRMPHDKNAAEARLTDGGVGKGNVRIEMRSKDSQRIHYHVEIWGEETRTAAKATNVGVMANRVLHYNGKKYCECS